MKLSEYKKALNLRLNILKINLVNTWQIETAYFSENWGNLLSTVMYTLTFVLFVNVIFANVNELAGYTKNEMLFFSMMAQLNFYLIYFWSFNNVEDMIVDVNKGNLDMVLTKPLPGLFYVSTRRLNALSILRDSIPPLAILITVIDWSTLHFSAWKILAAFLIMIFGQLAMNTFLFLLALPAFKYGEATEFLGLGFPLTGNDIPYEALTKTLRVFFSTVVPAFISAGISASVLLGKTDALTMVLFSFVVATFAMGVKIFTWKWALKSYTSASS